MTEEDITLINEYLRFEQRSHLDYLPDHSEVGECMKTIMIKWHERTPTGPFWMELVEPLVYKFSSLSSSLENILVGTLNGRYTERPYVFHDISTIYTLSRAQLEAYLTFFYLYIDPATEAEAQLRYYVYVLHSLKIRQSANVTEPELVNRKEEERKIIEEYLIKIQENKVYKSHPPDIQGRLRSGNRAKGLSWEKLIEQCKMNTQTLTKGYATATNHAHSEYMSLIQIRQFAKDPDSAPWLVPHIIKDSLMLHAVFIREVAVLTDMQDIYNGFSEKLKIRLRVWYNIITQLSTSTNL